MELANMSAHHIDVARKAVAIAMALCGVGMVVCVRQDDYLTGTLRQEPGIWRSCAYAFEIGVAASLVATFALVVEYLARPTASSHLGVGAFLLRLSVVTAVILGAGAAATVGLGFGQGIGTAIGAAFLFAAAREPGVARIVLMLSAAIVFGLIFLASQPPDERSEKGARQDTASSPLPTAPAPEP
jgi:hypothetical protein